MITKYTHADFKEMKRELHLTNFDIAKITGLTEGTVKNQTRPTSDVLPPWIRAMLYMWKRERW